MYLLTALFWIYSTSKKNDFFYKRLKESSYDNVRQIIYLSYYLKFHFRTKATELVQKC